MQPQSKVLVVDDHPTNIMIIREALDGAYQLATANSGEEALQIADDFQPDIILLDIMMPGIDGYEVCRRVRSNPALCHCKILMVSAKAMLSERLEGYDVGADDYITKPFEEEELTAKIRVYSRLKSMEEVDQLKSNVLTLLGHETRTPLNGIIAPAKMLASDEDIDIEEQKMLADMVYRNATRLHTLFEKVMLLSGLKSGKVDLAFEKTDLSKLVRRVISKATPWAEDNCVSLDADLPDSATAWFDPEHIERVIASLLDNAIRFSPSEESVTIGVCAEDDQVVLSVTDRGQGIDPEFLPHVLDDFTKDEAQHHAEGQGLSLAIARQIVLHHRGTINVQSTKGNGATFTVRLPISAPAPTERHTGPKKGPKKGDITDCFASSAAGRDRGG